MFDIIAALTLGAMFAVDVIVLVGLAQVRAAERVRVLGTAVMTTLPWIGVATLLVPVYLLTHFTIAARLRSMATGRLVQPAAGLPPAPTASSRQFGR